MKKYSISYRDLKAVIGESIQKFLKESEESFSVADYFDIQSLTKEKVLYMATDIRAYLFRHPYDLNLTEDGNVIQEDVSGVMPIGELKEELKKLGFRDWQINYEPVNNGIHIVILYADIAKNSKIITDAMMSCGWILAKQSEPVTIFNVPISIMEFDPKEQPSLNQDVRKYRYLYHLTPEQNVASIQANGIEARNENDGYYYSPKAHLIKGDTPKNEIEKFGWRLFNKNAHISSGEFALLRIDMSKVPNDIDFYGDGRYEFGVFSKETIPPSAIELIGYIFYQNKWNYFGEKIRFVDSSDEIAL